MSAVLSQVSNLSFLKWQLLFWWAARCLSCRSSVSLRCVFRLGENVTSLVVNSDSDQSLPFSTMRQLLNWSNNSTPDLRKKTFLSEHVHVAIRELAIECSRVSDRYSCCSLCSCAIIELMEGRKSTLIPSKQTCLPFLGIMTTKLLYLYLTGVGIISQCVIWAY